MTQNEKIAVIVLRALAYYLLLFVPIEWSIVAVGILLVNVGVLSRNSIAFEVRLLTSLVYLVAGLVLLARSGSLGRQIVQGFEDPDSGSADD
jgi:hypothetical protein